MKSSMGKIYILLTQLFLNLKTEVTLLQLHRVAQSSCYFALSSLVSSRCYLYSASSVRMGLFHLNLLKTTLLLCLVGLWTTALLQISTDVQRFYAKLHKVAQLNLRSYSLLQFGIKSLGIYSRSCQLQNLQSDHKTVHCSVLPYTCHHNLLLIRNCS